MGTNYYVAAEIECNNCDHKHMCKGGLHIGKSSYGWKFLFAFNGGEYYKTIDELHEFLLDKKIFDEYNREVSNTEFWNLVEQKQQTENEANFRTYVMNIDGYRFMDGEFS